MLPNARWVLPKAVIVIQCVLTAGCAHESYYTAPRGTAGDPYAVTGALKPRYPASKPKVRAHRTTAPAVVRTAQPAPEKASPPADATARQPAVINRPERPGVAATPPSQWWHALTPSSPQAGAPAPETGIGFGVAPTSPSAAAAAPQIAAVNPAAEQALRLLEEGRSLFRAGEVQRARSRFVAALSASLPDVLLELGRTYDGYYLGKLPKSDAEADPDRARAFYENATRLGSTAASGDLARLQAGLSTKIN